jgi:hypothetical protein
MPLLTELGVLSRFPLAICAKPPLVPVGPRAGPASAVAGGLASPTPPPAERSAPLPIQPMTAVVPEWERGAWPRSPRRLEVAEGEVGQAHWIHAVGVARVGAVGQFLRIGNAVVVGVEFVRLALAAGWVQGRTSIRKKRWTALVSELVAVSIPPEPVSGEPKGVQGPGARVSLYSS